jgi:hypothetical protein
MIGPIVRINAGGPALGVSSATRLIAKFVSQAKMNLESQAGLDDRIESLVHVRTQLKKVSG